MTKVQVCGVNSVRDALVCEKAGVDSIGFVNVESRDRSMPLDDIRLIASKLGPMTATALICFPKTAEEAIASATRAGVRIVQSYTLGADELLKIKKSGFRVVRAVHFNILSGKLEFAKDELRKIADVCDIVLFEPVLRGRAGGMGFGFDYSRLKPHLRFCGRFGIAGGLNAENVKSAVALRPYVVDVSSGVESERCVKDPVMVKAFVDACRGKPR